MLRTALAFALLVTPAAAQEPRTLTFTLTPEQVQVIAAGLGKLPMEQALPTFGALREQIEKQQRRPEPAPEPAK